MSDCRDPGRIRQDQQPAKTSRCESVTVRLIGNGVIKAERMSLRQTNDRCGTGGALPIERQVRIPAGRSPNAIGFEALTFKSHVSILLLPTVRHGKEHCNGF